MKSLEYLRVFHLQRDMHKVKVIKSRTGLFNEYVEQPPISSVAIPHPAIVTNSLRPPFALKIFTGLMEG